MTEPDRNRRRRELLDAVDAEMMRVHETVLGLMRNRLPEESYAVQLAVSGSLDQLVEAVDTVLGYHERPRADGDRVVLVDRSRAEPVESTYPIADWRIAGPRILAAALDRWAVEGGRVEISGSWTSGRGHIVTDIGAGRQAGYEAFAWYTPGPEEHDR
ncbi:hypothetical protein TPB0596_20770 [Tsukamurella pulmonis]|uniref:hypothetical protein n=1 Tax=Tsukamurella pulmonis TaxID=47312 RepID=UPI001EE021AB|nr:hypothetical protein [Tsukamurella pulmonis]BDD80670.1 hypothetical protein TPB0596_04330 [Tsukamurella pulmonis]BDD82314.1 hypothetical protein TPB0596_20770 [Tsukamurella pulmonis]